MACTLAIFLKKILIEPRTLSSGMIAETSLITDVSWSFNAWLRKPRMSACITDVLVGMCFLCSGERRELWMRTASITIFKRLVDLSTYASRESCLDCLNEFQRLNA